MADQIEHAIDNVNWSTPPNRNQQHAAARILLALKASSEPLPSMSHLEGEHSISRRTLRRARAKLARLGLVEHMSWMNSRHGGQQGWKLSSRMSSALRRLADWVDEWRREARPERMERDGVLVGLLR